MSGEVTAKLCVVLVSLSVKYRQGGTRNLCIHVGDWISSNEGEESDNNGG